MGSPARQKRPGLSFFASSTPLSSLLFLYLLSGFVVLSGFAFLSKMASSGFVVLSGFVVFGEMA